MKALSRLLLLLLFGLVLMGCSRVKFAYNQLDWLIPFYVQEYADLTNNQDSYLEQAVDGLLSWHCASHLSSYAGLLRETNAAFQQNAMDEEKLQALLSRIQRYWREIKQQASPAISKLLLTSSQAQIDEFFTRLKAKNEEWIEEYNSMSEPQLREKYAGRISDELERWFGPLHEEQQRAVSVWSQRFEPLGPLGLQARQQWQERLRRILESREEDQAVVRELELLFVHPDKHHATEYLTRLRYNQEVTIELVAEVGRQLDARQRKHLQRRTHAMAGDFDELACLEKTGNPSASAAPSSAELLLGTF